MSIFINILLKTNRLQKRQNLHSYILFYHQPLDSTRLWISMNNECIIIWFLCLFLDLRRTLEYFRHIDKIPVKGLKFWPIFGTHGHWTVRVFKGATPTVTRDICLYWSSPRTRDSHTCCQAFNLAVELSIPVFKFSI